MAACSPANSVSHVVQRYFSLKEAIPTTTDSNLILISHALYPSINYTENEEVEIVHWTTKATQLSNPGEDEGKRTERLGSLNTHLATHTTIIGSKPSVADAAVYDALVPLVKTWTSQERTGEDGYHHIVRYVDFVQNAPLFELSLVPDEKIPIDTNDVAFMRKRLNPRVEKERKKRERELATASTKNTDPKSFVVGPSKLAGGAKSTTDQIKEAISNVEDNVKTMATGGNTSAALKREKEKAPKAPKPPTKEFPLSPSLVDLRVGHILKAIAHPNADSLYVSTIACGDPPGTDNTFEYEGQIVRTVCSGLNGLVPLPDMQNRKIIVVCNLKAVTMRGIKSAAMVLAASPRLAEGEVDSHAGPVELVDPPDGASAGERVFFEGWPGEPDGVLNPKKKVWEMLQPGFTTTDDLGVVFDASKVEGLHGEAGNGNPGLGKLVAANSGPCSVSSLKGAVVR